MTNALVRAALAGALLAAAPLSPTVCLASLIAQTISADLAAERVQVLQLEQCQVQRDVRAMRRAGGPEPQEAIRVLQETKERMHAQLLGLGARMDASPALQTASEVIRESRLEEKLLFSLGTVEQWADGSELRIEAMIQEDLAQIRSRLAPGAAPVQCASPA
jgi:hypothetical protein